MLWLCRMQMGKDAKKTKPHFLVITILCITFKRNSGYNLLNLLTHK